MKEYDVYLFDFDGTLVDSYPSLIGVYQEGFATVGEKVTAEDAAIFMHEALVDSCARRNLSPEQTRKVISTIDVAIDEPRNLDKIVVYDDAIPVIKELYRRGKKLAIVSGNSAKHIKLVLEHYSVSSCFDSVIGASPNRRPKPYADPILDAIIPYKNVTKNRILYIGDSLQDPVTAFNAGVEAVLLDRKNEYGDYEKEKILTLDEILRY